MANIKLFRRAFFGNEIELFFEHFDVSRIGELLPGCVDLANLPCWRAGPAGPSV